MVGNVASPTPTVPISSDSISVMSISGAELLRQRRRRAPARRAAAGDHDFPDLLCRHSNAPSGSRMRRDSPVPPAEPVVATVSGLLGRTVTAQEVLVQRHAGNATRDAGLQRLQRPAQALLAEHPAHAVKVPRHAGVARP